MKRLLAATVIAYAGVVAGCTSGDRSVSLDDLKNADAPYYYVGSSFDGHDVSYVARYRAGMASILYGTCDVGGDGGCPPPLEIQHRLCFGVVTISIFVGQGAREWQCPPSGSRAQAAVDGRPGPNEETGCCVRQGSYLLRRHAARETLPNAGPRKAPYRRSGANEVDVAR